MVLILYGILEHIRHVEKKIDRPFKIHVDFKFDTTVAINKRHLLLEPWLPTQYCDEYVEVVEPDIAEEREHLVDDDRALQLVQDLKPQSRIQDISVGSGQLGSKAYFIKKKLESGTGTLRVRIRIRKRFLDEIISISKETSSY